MLASPDSPSAQLRDVIAATLHPAASEYKLASTILVTGNAGIGKRTLTRWTARDLGLHIMEVILTFTRNAGPYPFSGRLFRYCGGYRCKDGRDIESTVRTGGRDLSIHFATAQC